MLPAAPAAGERASTTEPQVFRKIPDKAGSRMPLLFKKKEILP